MSGLLILIAALGVTAPSAVTSTELSAPDFADEFEGTTLDASAWDDWVWSFPGRRSGFLFARDNVAVSNGCLNLTARFMRPEEKTVENLRRGFTTYATAYVRAKKKTFYGYYECRAKMMKAGVCNAFWLYDPLSDVPEKKFRPGDTTEEIDIYEVFGKRGSKKDYDCDRAYFTTVHRLKTPYLEGVVNGGVEKLEDRAMKTRLDFDFSEDFHTYGFLWGEKELVWYVDGKKVFSRENDVFHRPMHVTFDCEIMYDWIGEPAAEDLPATYQVDYFRYWKKIENSPLRNQGNF